MAGGLVNAELFRYGTPSKELIYKLIVVVVVIWLVSLALHKYTYLYKY